MACLSRWITIAKNYKNLLIGNREYTFSRLSVFYLTYHCYLTYPPNKVLLVPLLFSPLLQESWHQTIRTACDPTCETDCITGEDGSFYREEVKRVSTQTKVTCSEKGAWLMVVVSHHFHYHQIIFIGTSLTRS